MWKLIKFRKIIRKDLKILEQKELTKNLIINQNMLIKNNLKCLENYR